MFPPGFAGGSGIFAVLFGSMRCLFLKLIPRRSRKYQIVEG
jgi:hypothetical protein